MSTQEATDVTRGFTFVEGKRRAITPGSARSPSRFKLSADIQSMPADASQNIAVANGVNTGYREKGDKYRREAFVCDLMRGVGRTGWESRRRARALLAAPIGLVKGASLFNQ